MPKRKIQSLTPNQMNEQQATLHESGKTLSKNQALWEKREAERQVLRKQLAEKTKRSY